MIEEPATPVIAMVNRYLDGSIAYYSSKLGETTDNKTLREDIEKLSKCYKSMDSSGYYSMLKRHLQTYLNDETFDVTNIGVHLKAKEFNQILDDPNTIVVDFRNHYESEIGHFKGAITPDVETFRESLPIINEQLQDYKEDKNLVMYCTGGIRCEKASAYYKHKGFKNVFQLEGGIIEYTRQVKDQGLENKFLGKNFVFDHRRSERISDDVISNCHQCGSPFDSHTNCANEGCHLLFIQCDVCAEKMEHTCSDECHQIIQLPFEQQKELRKGTHASNKIFKKGRSQKLQFKK